MPALPGIQFGSGVLFAVPTSGNLAANPTPQEVGIIQNIKFTISGDIKELFGQKQWSIDSAVGKRSIKGSFEFAQMDNAFFNQCFFADTVSTGIVSTVYNEAHAVPASSTYTATVTNVPVVTDLGVVDLSTGRRLTKVASSPAAGQYSLVLSTGVYTFNAAEAGKAIAISYTYAQASVGTTLTVGNHVMGYGPVVSMTIPLLYQGLENAVSFPNVRLGKIDLATKQDDYSMLTTDFSAFAGANDNPMIWYNDF
jgi:hypothetical protein